MDRNKFIKELIKGFLSAAVIVLVFLIKKIVTSGKPLKSDFLGVAFIVMIIINLSVRYFAKTLEPPENPEDEEKPYTPEEREQRAKILKVLKNKYLTLSLNIITLAVLALFIIG